MRIIPRWLLAVLAVLLITGCGNTQQHPPVLGAVPNAIPLSQKGTANGVATLDGTKHVTQKQILTGGSAGECLQRKATEELQWGSCGTGGGKSQAEIEAFASTRNLSNVNTAGEARTNLGLGTIATRAATEFATTTELALKAPLASPAFTGVPTAPTAVEATNTTQLATTAFAHTVATAAQTGAESAASTSLALKAPLASPTFTGIPLAPTAAAATNTTQLATTAFVQTAKSEAEAASLSKSGTAVKATNIEAGAVTEPKIASEAVTLGKIKAAAPAAGKVLAVKAGGTELEWATVAGGTLPEWLTGLETKSSSSGKIKLNLEKARAFSLTITEATTIEFEKVPAGLEAEEVLVFFKENATGGFAVSFNPAIKWVGTTPTFSTVAEAESLATLIVRGEAGKAAPTNVFGISGAEGKQGPAGPTGPEGKETKHFTTPIGFAVPGVLKTGETYPGVFWPALATGQKDKILKEKCKTTKGEITVNFRKEGTEIAGLKKAVSSTASEASPSGTTEPASGDYIDLAVSAEASTPENLACSLTVEHTVEK